MTGLYSCEFLEKVQKLGVDPTLRGRNFGMEDAALRQIEKHSNNMSWMKQQTVSYLFRNALIFHNSGRDLPYSWDIALRYRISSVSSSKQQKQALAKQLEILIKDLQNEIDGPKTLKDRLKDLLKPFGLNLFQKKLVLAHTQEEEIKLKRTN